MIRYLRRAAQKEAVQAAIELKNTLPVIDGRALAAIENIADEVHRRVVVQGVWQSAHTIYLDNRPMSGRSGFWVLTPLALQGGDRMILVQRGWVARNFLDRTALPVVDSPAGEVEVLGRMAPPPSKLYAFKGLEAGAIRQNLDLADFSAETGLALLPLSVLQSGPAEGRMQRDWPPANLGVEKHYGYAFQWFGLCTLIAILYVWFQIVRRFFSFRRA